MLEKVLPHAMLKAKSNLESRIRTLKRDWAIIDEHRQMVVAEDAVWNSYINIVEEIDVEDVATANNLKEGNNYHKCKNVVSLDKMDVSTTQSQLSKPNQD
ncbi:hypothetical protein Godav_023131, partial [Gossypium davidsonii]|nr:hypothetical protein [Gossypium davidsonii]